MKRRDIIGREPTFGAPIPRGWRLAWYEPQRRVGVYSPMPLHWLAGAAREIGWRIGVARNAARRERHESNEMQRIFASASVSLRNTPQAIWLAGMSALTHV